MSAIALIIETILSRAGLGRAPRRPGGMPRGLARSGPPILSYGFRPFFLGAGILALLDMVLWVGALSGFWNVGGDEGPVLWHAHEMLFGYAAAAMCGFVLTAVPNWTGRLPVSGPPLAALVALWGAGRIAMLLPMTGAEWLRAGLDAVFLPVLAIVVAREVIVGRNWQNLRVAIGIAALGGCNLWMHAAILSGSDAMLPVRITVGLFVMLVIHIGGRIVPSFTRNVLARRARPTPRPKGRLDTVAIVMGGIAVLAWAVVPDHPATAVVAVVAAGAQAVRLAGWRGWDAADDPLLLVLHVGYLFVPLGFIAIAAAATGWLSSASALHVLTVGVIGLMTLAVMTRASRGHTGRPLRASRLTSVSYLSLGTTALLRPLAEIFPAAYHPILDASALTWLLAYAIFIGEHAPMLLGSSLTARRG